MKYNIILCIVLAGGGDLTENEKIYIYMLYIYMYTCKKITNTINHREMGVDRDGVIFFYIPPFGILQSQKLPIFYF